MRAGSDSATRAPSCGLNPLKRPVWSNQSRVPLPADCPITSPPGCCWLKRTATLGVPPFGGPLTSGTAPDASILSEAWRSINETSASAKSLSSAVRRQAARLVHIAGAGGRRGPPHHKYFATLSGRLGGFQERSTCERPPWPTSVDRRGESRAPWSCRATGSQSKR